MPNFFSSTQNNSEALNEVFENHLEVYFSSENLRTIAALYTPEIAQQAKLIYDAAIDYPVDWRTANMNEALLVLSRFLQAEFLWMSDATRQRFTFAFIMTWK